VELYAAVLLALGAWLLFRLRLRYPAPGLVTALGLTTAGLARLLTEPLRPSLQTGPVGWYGAAILVGLAAALTARRLVPDPDGPDALPLQ
jgi:prolipoprotein diacylglyceryltransferase